MNKELRTEDRLAKGLLREAKFETDPCKLKEIAQKLDQIGAWCDAARLRLRARQLSDKEVRMG